MGCGDFLEFLELFFNGEMCCGVRWCDMLLRFLELFVNRKSWCGMKCVTWYLNYQNYFSMEKGDIVWGDFLKFLEKKSMEKDIVA
jgi:hypothetical protein